MDRVLHNYIIVIISGLMMMGVGYLVAIKPDKTEYAFLLKQYDSLKTEWQSQKNQYEKLQISKKNLASLNQNFLAILKNYPETFDMPVILKHITNIVQKTGVTLEFFSPQPEVKYDSYKELALLLHLKGNYDALVHFLNEVEALKFLMQLQDFEIVNQKSTLLTMKITLKIYKVKLHE